MTSSLSALLAFGSDGVSDESHDPHRDQATSYTPRDPLDRAGYHDEDDG